MKYVAALACSVAACGSSTHAHEPHAITLTLGAAVAGPPAYLEYRDGDGAWQAPIANPDGTVPLVVTDLYEVTVVFINAQTSQFEIDEVRATADDPAPTVGTPDYSNGGAPANHTTHQLTGNIASDGGVEVETPPDAPQPSIGFINGSVFTVDTFDTSSYLFAYPPYQNGALVRVARRPITPGADGNIGDIILATEAMNIPTHLVGINNQLNNPLNPLHVAVDGPGRLPMRFGAPITGVAFDMPLLPEPLRQPDDHYTVTVNASTRLQSQRYVNTDAESVGSIDLMSPVDVSFVYSPASATWAIDDRDATLWVNNGSVTHYVRATNGWIVATGATSLTIQQDQPGFDTDWRIDPVYSVPESLTLSTSTPTSVNSVTMSN